MSLRQSLYTHFLKRRKESAFWIEAFLYATLFITFGPFVQWLLHTHQDQSRILNALIILVVAILFLIRFNRLEVKEPLVFDREARNSLTLGFLALALSFVIRFAPVTPILQNLSIIITTTIAFCVAIHSLIIYLFSNGIRRISITACGTFSVFIIISSLMDTLDWPLRALAGKWSGYLLNSIGKTAELSVHSEPNSDPVLLLIVENNPFQVAAECNGFGVILSSLLLALMLGIYYKLKPLNLAVNITAALFLGFVFNIIRIFCIILLAPNMMAYYDIMHETVGFITFWGCLIAVWVLLNGPTREQALEAN